jgi:hypothetical protein
MTVVEKELEEQSGDLVVAEADVSEHALVVDAEDEPDAIDVASVDELGEIDKAGTLDEVLEGEALEVDADESEDQALVVLEDERDDAAAESPEEVEEVADATAMDVALDGEPVLVEVEATADEEALEPAAVDVEVEIVEESDDDLAHTDDEETVDVLGPEDRDSEDMAGEPSEPVSLSEALEVPLVDEQGMEEESGDIDETMDILEPSLGEEVLAPEGDRESTGDIDWFGDDDEPTGLAHVDSTELDSDVLKPLADHPISRHRLAVPVVMVDADDAMDVLVSDGMDMLNDVPQYRGIHRVAVPLGDDDSWALEVDSLPNEDEDDGLIVEVLVDGDTLDDDNFEELATVPFVLGGNLDEFDFFLQNGFHAEAAAVLDEMERANAEHPEVVRRREILNDNAVSTW